MLKRIPHPSGDLGNPVCDGVWAFAYSAADQMADPIRAESFGLVALEAMAGGALVAALEGEEFGNGRPEIFRRYMIA